MPPSAGRPEILTFELRLEGEKSGMRLNAIDHSIVAVYGGSSAHSAGLMEGDVVIAVDGQTCGSGVGALQLWTEGTVRKRRTVTIRRPQPASPSDAASLTDTIGDATSLTNEGVQMDRCGDSCMCMCCWLLLNSTKRALGA